MAFARLAQRVYKRSALEAHLANFDFSWESRFAESELAAGRALYRSGAVRVLELQDDIAIACLKLPDGTEPYCVIDFEGARFSVRTLTHDDRVVAPYAIAGLYEIEELIADEITPLKYEAPQTSETAAPAPEKEAALPESSMKLSLQFSLKRDALVFQSYWKAKGGLKPVFGKKSIDASGLNFSERENLVRLASFARKAGFAYDGKSYTCKDPSKISQFARFTIKEWRKYFEIKNSDDLRLVAQGVHELNLRAKLKLKGGLLDTDIYGLMDGERIGYRELKSLKGWGGRARILPRRGLVRISEEDEKLLAAADASLSDFKGEIPPYMMFTLFDGSAKISLSQDLQEWKSKVFSPRESGIEISFLREYQREGVMRALSLFEGGCGILLADEMGLGKTVQALSVIYSLKRAGDNFLIVCPASVIPVWKSEVEKFFSDLEVKVLDSASTIEASNSCTLWLSSYTQLRRNKSKLDGVNFKMAVLDEAQFIKNPDSKVSEACMSIRADHKMALSGTPLENRLLDVWTIFRFIMPGLMGRRHEFELRLDTEPDFAEKIKRQIAPFVMRRLKNEVARELPAKNILDLPCPLTPMQSAEYQKLLDNARKLAESGEIANSKGRVSMLSLLTRLRQASCDPSLLPWVGETDFSNSGKISALTESLESIIASGRKAVVFSQFTSFIARMRASLSQNFDAASIFELTGTTRDRAAPVAAFQNKKGAAVIFVSLRAGGTGITLTDADYVFLADPWWNPAVEAQAIDRVHRIGKTNDVFVYRLIAQNTVEEHVRKLQQKKAALFDDIFSSLSNGGANFEESIMEILGL